MGIYLALFLPLLSSAEDLSGNWSGEYFYRGETAGVPFTVKLEDRGAKIQGTIREKNTFGDPKAAELGAVLAGAVEGDKVSFSKIYDGTGGAHHSVLYSGTLREGRITGTWVLSDGSQGSFSMWRPEKAPPPPPPSVPEPQSIPASPAQ